MVIETISGESIYPESPIAKKMTYIDFFLEILSRDQLKLIDTLTNAELQGNIFTATTIWEMIHFHSFSFSHVL